MNNQATGSSSGIKRKHQLYADTSSLPSSRASASVASSSASSIKENTPSRLTGMDTDSSITSLSSSTSPPGKRRLSDASLGPDETSGPENKKTKISPTTLDPASPDNGALSAPAKKKKKRNMTVATALKSDEFPNGYFYCHQCNKKRDMSEGIQCTLKDMSSNIQNARCKAKYCGPCLKNRYGESIEDIRTQTTAGMTRKERERHIPNESFAFQCPRCRSVCNCRVCRKAQGLEPTGNLTFIARREGKESAASILNNDPKATGVLPGKGKQLPPVEKEKKQKIPKAKEDKASAAARKKQPKAKDPSEKPKAPRAKPVPKPKPPPNPLWTRVPTSLTQSTAEARIHIREFALRFASIMDIAKSNLEELEELETERISGGSYWEDDEEDEGDLIGWVSENCVKSLVMALLTLIAESHKLGEVVKAIKDALKDIRSSGSNLNKIWTALWSLRQTLEDSHSSFTFPDPLPPPSSMTYRATRSALGAEVMVNVATSAQLVPVVIALMDQAIETQAVRDEIERGAVREKELTKDAREAIAQKNAKWKEAQAGDVDENKAKSKGKAKAKDVSKTERGLHKQMIQGLEHAHRVVQYECIPRFRELGRDHEGRIYYALTPGPVERDAAGQLLAGHDGRVKFTKRRGPITVEERKGMQKWSWFIAVWGRRPEGAIVAKSEDEDDDNIAKVAGADEEEWWGFWDPQEIGKVAEWIALTNHLGEPKNKDSLVAGGETATGEGVGNTSADPKQPKPARENHADPFLLSSGLQDSRPPSPMSDISSVTSSDREDDEDIQMRVDDRGHLLPSRQQLQDLVRGLNEYAVLLKWRSQRMQGNETVEKDKEARIPAKSFYGI